MKKKIVIIVIVVFIISIVSGIMYYYKKTKENYISNFEKIEEKRDFQYSIYCDEGVAFLNTKDMISLYAKNNPDSLLIVDVFFKDPLSSKEELLKHYPIYDFERNICSVILLSAGIDGKMDNKLTDKDSLFIYDWWGKLKLYNPEDAFLDYHHIVKNRVPKFSFKDYLFGDKDYLINFDCHECVKLKYKCIKEVKP